ncbi:MAG: hypothetical protein M1481_07385 [Candidatus Thermoplasmatota archaeon]|nr:hypothetical protein [Candidatus Thermoplasmatota archaeon]MCL5963428.1 hypothetical protein [Candidatus Thermoplasmatota archaeon]
MKIDIGDGGKIIGTKRVSPNGQVSGLSDYAGKEVLVILPGKSENDDYESKFFVDEIKKAIEMQMQVLFDQYKEIENIYDTPMDAARIYFNMMYPKSFRGLVDSVDKWVKEQIRVNERIIKNFYNNEDKDMIKPERKEEGHNNE